VAALVTTRLATCSVREHGITETIVLITADGNGIQPDIGDGASEKVFVSEAYKNPVW